MAWLPEMRIKYPQKTKRIVSRSENDLAEATNGGIVPPASAVTAPADEEMLTPLEQMAQSFHSPDSELSLPEFCTRMAPAPTAAAAAAPAETAAAGGAAAAAAASPSPSPQPWGLVHMRLTSGVTELSVTKRLTALVLASLRASGTFRIFVEAEGPARQEFYVNLGFRPVGPLPVQQQQQQQQPQSDAAGEGSEPQQQQQQQETSPTTPTAAAAVAGRSNGMLRMVRSF